MTRRKERQARRNLALAMAGQKAEEQVTRVGFASVSRVEAARREMELCATSEALDQHGTIFDYAASKDAFTRWMGNVREMHEHVAVGRRMAVRFEDETRRIFDTIRISRGAEATLRISAHWHRTRAGIHPCHKTPTGSRNKRLRP